MKSQTSAPSSASLSDLPNDELAAYGRKLGLFVDDQTPRGELLRLIRKRQELLIGLDREALLDIVVWARIPIRRSASKEQLAQHVTTVIKINFDSLSDRGVRALAGLRGISFSDQQDLGLLRQRLRKQEGLWARVTRKRRRLVGAWIAKALSAPSQEGEYQFLPEDDGSPSLQETIEDVGVVGGIAQKLRGAADRYVEDKLDQIERRIDRKLDEIDQRLSEWRDREVTNRLKLIIITLITTIIVALVSLGYHYLKSGINPTEVPAIP